MCVYLRERERGRVYLSAAAGLSLLCTELGPQVRPFFLMPFFTSSNSSGLKRELRPHVRLLSSWVTVNTAGGGSVTREPWDWAVDVLVRLSAGLLRNPWSDPS